MANGASFGNPLMPTVPEIVYPGAQGLPGADNPLLQLLLQGALAQLSGRTDRTLLGLTRANPYQQMQMAGQWSLQERLYRDAAERDRTSVERVSRGLLAMMDITPTTPGFEGSLRDFSGLVAPGLAMGARMAPRFVDDVTGGRSALAMTPHVAALARFRLDPVTGLPGMSADSAQALQRRLHDDFLARPWAAGTGFGAGETASLFSALQQQGFIGGGQDELARMRAGGASDMRLRNFDAQKVKDSLNEYAGAVKAMQEIFGADGRPNAPMRELITALEGLTGGAMRRLGGPRAAEMIRTTYNLAQGAGYNLQGLTAITMQGQQEAMRAGLDPLIGALAVQEGLAAEQAYAAMGLGNRPGWNNISRQEFGQQARAAYLGAAGSARGNEFGILARLSSAGAIRPGTRAARIVEAAERGLVSNEMWRTTGEFQQLLAEGTGSDPAVLQGYFSQRQANQTALARAGWIGVAQQLQNPEVTQQHIPSVVSPVMWRATRNERQAGILAHAFAQTVTEDVTAELLAPERRQDLHQTILKGIRRRVGGAADTSRLDAALIESAIGEMERPRDAQGRPLMSLESLRQRRDPAVEAQKNLFMNVERQKAKIQDSLAKFPAGSPLQRAVQALTDRDADDAATLTDVFVAAMGGTPTGKLLQEAHGAAIQNLAEAERKLDLAKRQFASATPEQRAQRARDVETAAQGVLSAHKTFREIIPEQDARFRPLLEAPDVMKEFEGRKPAAKEGADAAAAAAGAPVADAGGAKPVTLTVKFGQLVWKADSSAELQAPATFDLQGVAI